jgi:hypothetical protein
MTDNERRARSRRIEALLRATARKYCEFDRRWRRLRRRLRRRPGPAPLRPRQLLAWLREVNGRLCRDDALPADPDRTDLVRALPAQPDCPPALREILVSCLEGAPPESAVPAHWVRLRVRKADGGEQVLVQPPRLASPAFLREADRQARDDWNGTCPPEEQFEHDDTKGDRHHA